MGIGPTGWSKHFYGGEVGFSSITLNLVGRMSRAWDIFQIILILKCMQNLSFMRWIGRELIAWKGSCENQDFGKCRKNEGKVKVREAPAEKS